MKPDLDSIYVELDLRPGCSLEEFKHAYRRRVAELHPDRPGARSAQDQAVLRDLIRVYTAVTRFHRRYGRMPGGTQPQMHPTGTARFFDHDRGLQDGDSDAGSEARGTRATLTLVGLFIALVLLLASWSWLASSPESGSRKGSAPAQLSEPESPATLIATAMASPRRLRACIRDPAGPRTVSERHA